MMNDENIGKKIREARRAKGWTQDDLARAVNVCIGTVGNWESGRTKPWPRKVRQIMEILKREE